MCCFIPSPFWLYQVLLMWICRCGTSYCLYHTGLPVCTATLRYTPGWLHFCSSGDHMAPMYNPDRCLQYYSLGTHCISSIISVLHVQVLEEDTERRLDIPGRNTAMCNWYAQQTISEPFVLIFGVSLTTRWPFHSFRFWSNVCWFGAFQPVVNTGEECLLQTNFSPRFILEAVYGELFSDKKILGRLLLHAWCIQHWSLHTWDKLLICVSIISWKVTTGSDSMCLCQASYSRQFLSSEMRTIARYQNQCWFLMLTMHHFREN